MLKHIRLQGNRYSFRLRVFDRYLDAGESYVTEEEAAFAVDLAKMFLRNYFNVTKNTEPSLDSEAFCMWAHRLSVDLSDRSSIESKLAPGVLSFVANNRAALDAHADANRPQLRDWEKLRHYDNPVIREWVQKCDAAEYRASEFKKINHEYLDACLASVSARLAHVVSPLGRAITMHGRSEYPALHARLEQMHELRRQIEALAIVSDEMRVEFLTDNRETHSALGKLEANRPPLI